MQAPDLVPVIPEIILIAAACAILMVEVFLKRDRTAVVAIALTALVASAVVCLGLFGQNRVTFAGMLVLNNFAVFFKILFAAGGIVTVLMSPGYLEAQKRHVGEYYALLLFAIVGMDLMSASRDLIAFYVAFELMSIASYLLAAFFRYQVKSNEAALKYLLSGAFASAIMLYGISLVYGITGVTNYSGVAKALGTGATTAGLMLAMFLVVIGLAFKVSAVPFHNWVPDVYQGAPTPIAGFFSAGPKAAAFSVILALFTLAFPNAAHDWAILFIVLSIVTMFVGNVVALTQRNIKRMLAYSSIAHAGYLLAGVAALGYEKGDFPGQAVLIYLAAYTFMNLGAFGVLAYLKTQQPERFDYSLSSLAGLGRRSPWAAVLLSLFMFSLTGVPGTAGFIGKFYLFGAVVHAGLWWLAIIGVLLSAVSGYFYLRVVVYLFFREPEEEMVIRQPLGGSMAAAQAICALFTLVVGFVPTWLWDSVVRSFAHFFG
jgi:NADH-quinone oxidoreductase subunit N